MLRRVLPFLCLFLLAHAVIAQVASNAEIERILAERIDRQHQSVGIVAGAIEPGGRRIVAHGSLAKGDKRPLDGDTVYEIGSATKVFTSLLLADMVRRGEVALTDPVAKYLPAEVKVPERDGAKITLQQLAMHTSGLPSLPSNFSPKDPNNPYADYSVQQLYDFLSLVELTRDPGSRYEYSNLGAGLLGVALARRAGTDYETLVRNRILDPLGMKSTGITLSKSMKERLATGHDMTLKPVLNWDFPALAGAGALRSTADDMLTFLAANLGYTKTALAAPMTAMLVPRHATMSADTEVALGWHISKIGEHEIVWHNGGTGGYRSFMGFDPKRRIGVVVLSNASTNAGVDDIGRHLLAGAPLLPPPKTRTEVTIDPKLFDRYTGRYELVPNVFFTITRDDAHLYAQITGQPRWEIFPESERDFFYKVVDAQITFVENGLVLHQNGKNQPAKRVGDAPPVKEHREVAVDPKIFDRYVGKYQLAPEFVLTITRDEGHLYAQATNQPRFEIFPESETEFFFKVVDAQITFGDKNLVLHQNGRDVPAKRIEATPPASRTVPNPDFVVFRPVGTDPSAGSATASVDDRTYHFNPAERVVDLREIDVDSCRAERTPHGGWAVFGKLTPDGARKFGQWTQEHINQQLGIFVGGRLISAPYIRSRIDDAFVIEGTFTQAEVEDIVARLRSGGS